MLLKYDYWYFTSVISSEQCDAIVLKYLKQKSKKAITGTESKKLKSKSKLNKKDLLDLKKTRNFQMGKVLFLVQIPDFCKAFPGTILV